MRAALFDMDGLMLDTESIFYASACEIGNILGLPDIENVAHLLIGVTVESANRILFEHYGHKADGVHDKMMRHEFEIVHKTGIAKKKGIVELLTFLKENGFKIAVASSSNKDIVISDLECTGLLDYFDFIVGGDMVNKSKPEPDIYLYACEKLGVSADEAIGFEDSYNGIRSLYAAGIKAFMIPDMLPPTDEMYEKAYAVCDSLLDALEIIKREL